MMKKVLILGANGQITRLVTEKLGTLVEITLFVRNSTKLTDGHNHVIIGDVLNADDLVDAMKGQDIVYANLGPSPMAQMAKAVIKAAEKSNVKRLIWVATIGIYEEEPKEAIPEMRLQGGMMDDPNSYIGDERLGADIIEASSIISTIIRPNLLTNDGQSDYVVNARTDEVEVAEVSRANVAHFISQLILQPEQYQNDSVAITNL